MGKKRLSSRFSIPDLALKLSCIREVFQQFSPGSNIKTIQGHHLGPCINEVTHKLFFSVVGCIDFCDSTQLGAGTEDKVDGGGRPSDLACRTITTLVYAFGF